jgi:hypothetical protein
MKASLGKTKAILEKYKDRGGNRPTRRKARDFEVYLQETDAIADRWKVPNEEASVEANGALEDRYGNRCLAVGCHRQPKKLTQDDDGSRKKLDADRGR